MGMGKPPQRSTNSEEFGEFIDRYSSAVGGEYPVDTSKHSEALTSIKNAMQLSRRTLERYWKIYRPIAEEFGLPPPIYEINRDVYEDLATVIEHYRLLNTPIRDGNTTRPPMQDAIVHRIASRTGKNYSAVEQHLQFFNSAVADVFDLPKDGDPDEKLFEDLVTFIDRYNSLMNSPHFEDEVALPQRRKKALKKIAVRMDKDLPSIERYWKVFEHAADHIKAPPIADTLEKDD